MRFVDQTTWESHWSLVGHYASHSLPCLLLYRIANTQHRPRSLSLRHLEAFTKLREGAWPPVAVPGAGPTLKLESPPLQQLSKAILGGKLDSSCCWQ